MSEVFAIRYIKLRPDIAIEEFEAFARNIPQTFSWPGMKWIVAKGDRGDRSGRYALIEDFESVEVRDHYFPADGVSSLEAQQLFAASIDFIADWNKYGSSADDLVIFTDYAVIGEF